MAIQELDHAEIAAVSGGSGGPAGLIVGLLDSKLVQDLLVAGSKGAEAFFGVVGKLLQNPVVGTIFNDSARLLGKILGKLHA